MPLHHQVIDGSGFKRTFRATATHDKRSAFQVDAWIFRPGNLTRKQDNGSDEQNGA
jgi:hypothetical protein